MPAAGGEAVKALVTGATGFIGGALAHDLRAAGHQVAAICRDGECPEWLTQFRGDIEDLRVCERAINEFQPDEVYHLAAQAIVPHAKRDPYSTLETNVRGTYNMLEAFRRHRSDASIMVVASSDKAYGELVCFADWASSYKETDPLRGRGPYDVSKSCADLIAQSYAHEYGIPIGIVRAGNVYGPSDPDQTRIVPTVAAALIDHSPVKIMSDGSPVRDYLWIGDAVDGYVKLAEYLRVGAGTVRHSPRWPIAVNLSGGEPVSVLRLVEIATDVYKGIIGMPEYSYPPPEILGTRTGEINVQVLDTALAKRELKWAPRVSLREGLERTIRHALDKRRYEKGIYL